TSQPYCQSVISPKVAKLRKKHAEKLQQRTTGR
ncbi:MAG: peptide-methionine (S)-S-oxide reductase, partial [Bacteroidetes bacterium QH_6_64_77]